MSIGTIEGIIIGVIVIGFVSIFGRSTLKNIFRTVLGARKDFEEIKKEMSSTKKHD